MTDRNGSAVLTTVSRSFAGVDTQELANRLGLLHHSFDGLEPELGAVVSEDPLGAGPALIRGTENVSFDAEMAAALGIPLILVVDRHDATVALAKAQAKRLAATVGGAFTAEELGDTQAVRAAIETPAQKVISAPVFEYQLLSQARAAQAHIVLPEGDDDRILLAADRLLRDNICRLTILGNPEEVRSREEELGIDLRNATIIDHLSSPHIEDFAETFAELRKKKGVTLDEARETMKDISYFATMMIYKGLADGMVSGAAHTTAHTIRPSFQIIKTRPEASVVSSIFLMVMRGRLWAFGDCAVNPNPTAEQLGEIAVVSAHTAAQFGIDPRVAILSYSTGSSGSGPDVDRAVAAVEKARSLDPSLKVDGPLQFDAAVDPGVAKKKMPESEVAGKATVFVFPDLEAGNIGYKTAQRTGAALAVGPVLQGLNKPVNDLSRGATVPDIVNTVAVTAIQAGGEKAAK